MKSKKLVLFLGFSLAWSLSLPGFSAVPEARLISFDEIEAAYEGAFTVSYADDVSNTGYIEGKIAYDRNRNSIFLDSHTYEDAIGEFSLPSVLSTTKEINDLPLAVPVQGFSTVLDRSKTGNSQKLDNIGALALVDGSLWIQAYEFYDAPADNTDTTLIIRSPSNLENSEVDGFFQMEGAAKTISYISKIPLEWQESLQGEYLAGNGGGVPINSRLSIGPSLYAFSPTSASGNSGVIPTKEWLSYPLLNALSTKLYTFRDDSGPWDSYNRTGMNSDFEQSNRLWTEASSAAFAFIMPGTSTFVVIGESGMHESGGGYKITQTDGTLCPGGCAYDPKDQYPYYWLYDLKEIIRADHSYDPLPYEYGKFDNHFPNGFPTGGTFDLETKTLLLVNKSATEPGEAGDPVITVYDLSKISTRVPRPPEDLRVD